MPEMEPWQIVLCSLFASLGLLAAAGIVWWLVRNTAAVKAMRRELDRIAGIDRDRRYLDWLEGQLAGLPDNDVEHEGEAPK